MAVIALETRESRAYSEGSIEFKYDVLDRAGSVVDTDDALDAVWAASPEWFSTADEDFERIWPPALEPNGRWLKATVQYAPEDPNNRRGGQDPDIGQVSFQVAAQQTHIQQSLGLGQNVYKRTQTPALPDWKYTGAIGTDAEGQIHGCDILTPSLSMSQTVFFDLETITHDWVRDAGAVVGRTNDAQFLGYAEGELLLTGIQGSRNVKMQRWEITFNFLFSKNETDIEIDGTDDARITGIAKKGHEYLEVVWQPKKGNMQINMMPNYVIIHRVYKSADFTTLGWGASGGY